MVITVLKSRLLRFFASRTRLAIALGAVCRGGGDRGSGRQRGRAAAGGPAGPRYRQPRRSLPGNGGRAALLDGANCIAVGANTPQMATQLVAERWNGSRWTRSAMPKPAGADEVTIGGVACPTRTECVAVGTGYPPATSKAASPSRSPTTGTARAGRPAGP